MNNYQLQCHLEAKERDNLVKKLYDEGMSYQEISIKTGFKIKGVRRSIGRLGLKGSRNRYNKNTKEVNDYKNEIKRLRLEGALITEIANRLGKSASTIREHLINLGFNPDDRDRTRDENRRVIKECHERGLSIKQISDKTGFSSPVISYTLKCLGLKPNFKCGDCGKSIGIKLRLCDSCKEKRKELRPIKEYKYEYNKPKNLEEYIKYKIGSIRSGSKKRGLDFNIDEEYLTFLLNISKERCVYTGNDLKMMSGNKKTLISIDRFDNSKGYVKGNVIPCCGRINEKKGDLSLEELKEYMPIVYTRGLEFLKSMYKV